MLYNDGHVVWSTEAFGGRLGEKMCHTAPATFASEACCRYHVILHGLKMAKNTPQIDVLVLGGHPSAYLAAALLRHKCKLQIVHCAIPGEQFADRLVMLNPALYSLHPVLEPLRRKIEARAVYGLQFLADDPAIRSEYRSRSAVASVAQFRDLQQAMCGLARAQGVQFITPAQLRVHRLNERGVEISVAGQLLLPKALVLAGRLSDPEQRILGLPDEWERGIVHRFSFCMVRGTRLFDGGARPLVPMSLDLRGTLSWAWLLPGPRHTQLVVEQKHEAAQRSEPIEVLSHWAAVLRRHGALNGDLTLAPGSVYCLDLPLAGALAHEGVASRTLLVGPAGGFYSACGEDIYPTCWSAIYAADVLKKALKEPHLQDALQPYRHRWRTTLGDYLRGPQANLKFLLPLVYRNQIMTNRLAEAILTGESVVR